MAMFKRKPVVIEAVQITVDTEIDLGGDVPQLVRAGEWVLTFPGDTKTMMHDVVFQRDFLPQGPG